MVTTTNWIPFTNIYEYRLLTALAKLRKESVRKLNFGQPPQDFEMVALLPRRQPKPLALYIIPPRDEAATRAELDALIASRPDLGAWIWDVASEEMPAFGPG